MLSTVSFHKLLNSTQPIKASFRTGDYLVFILGIIFVVYLFQTLWTHQSATKVQIRLGDKIYATYSLNQTREIHIKGQIGESVIHIAQGKVRFEQSPCNNQYCVHQGWLTQAGQVSICLPNQISLELLGESKPYDTLNY